MKSRSTIARIVRSLFVLAVCGLTASDESNAAAQESEVHPLPFQSMCESTLFAMTDPCESCLERIESWLDGQDCSLRSGLHDNGVTLTNNLTNFYVGNTLGGNSQQFNFAGHGDYLAKFNIHKMGGPQGQFLQIRAEHRYGQSITPASGALLPPILTTDIPVRDSEQLYVTNFLFTQAFSESFAVYAGKLDTLGGMNDSLTSGRGIDQFSNLSLINNPLGVKSVAYSTLGAGFVILNEGETIFNFLVFNARDTASTVGLSELFADGVVLAPTLRLPTNFMELPGYQSFGGIWSSRDFASLNQSPQFLLPDVPIARQSDTWALMFEFDQFLLLTPTTANTVGISSGGRASVTWRPIRRVSS